MFIIDRTFQKSEVSKTDIRKCLPISLREIGAARYLSDEWFFINMYLEEKNHHETKILTHIRREVHLVDNLKTKFLIEMDILDPEHITINISERKLHFESCERITVSCEIKTRDNVRIRRTVRTTKKKIIPVITTDLIPVILKEKEDLPERDFLFEPTIPEAYAHFVDSEFEFINIRKIRTFL